MRSSAESSPSFRIRPVAESDAEAMREIYAPIVRDTPISFELEVPSAEEIARRIAEHTAFAPWLVAEDGGNCLGYAYGSKFRGREAYRLTVETTIYVAATSRRTGVGRDLYRALLDAVRSQGFRTAIAGITLPNAASVRFHESLGFVPVGVFHNVGRKFGAWHDVGFWEQDLGATPEGPHDDSPHSAPSKETS